jgi:tRNA threonylcarbamoyladenosine dehydratase
VAEFLRDVAVYVDGLDFLALPVRRMVFAKRRGKGIPVLTSAPLGMGVVPRYFSPTGMSSEDCCRWEGHELEEQYPRFIPGLSPAMVQRH